MSGLDRVGKMETPIRIESRFVARSPEFQMSAPLGEPFVESEV